MAGYTAMETTPFKGEDGLDAFDHIRTGFCIDSLCSCSSVLSSLGVVGIVAEHRDRGDCGIFMNQNCCAAVVFPL